VAWFLGGSFETRIYRWHQSIIRDLKAKSREELGEEFDNEEERMTTLEAIYEKALGRIRQRQKEVAENKATTMSADKNYKQALGGIHQCLWIVVTQRNIISKEFDSMIV
jgi:hypothetical protein